MPGAIRNATMAIIAWRSRKSELTDSEAKNCPKNSPKRTRNLDMHASVALSAVRLHQIHHVAGSLFDALFGDQRRKHRIERRKPQRGAQLRHRVVADDAAVLE